MTDGLVTIPAMLPAGPSAVEIRFGGVIVGDLDYRVCGDCQRGVIEHVRIGPPHRRRGFATRAVHVVLDAYPTCRWSTSPIDDTPAAQGFWCSLD